MTVGAFDSRQAGQLTRRLVRIPFPFKGINRASPGLLSDPSYAADLNGVRAYAGELRTHPGLVGITAQNLGTPLSVYSFTSSISSYTYAIAGTTNALYWLRSGDSTWIDISPSTPPSATYPWAFTHFYEKLIASDYITGLYHWPGLDGNFEHFVTDYGAQYLETYANRILLGNVNDHYISRPERLAWSAYGDYTDFELSETAGSVDLVDLPGEITGLRTLGGYLYIYKRNGIIRCTETGLVTPPFAFQTIVDGREASGSGTIAGRTITLVHGAHFYLGFDDVYIFDGNSSRPIGMPIRDDLFANLDLAYARNCWAYHLADRCEWWLFIVPNGSATPTRAYIYNYLSNSWSILTVDAVCGAHYDTYDDSFDSAVGPIYSEAGIIDNVSLVPKLKPFVVSSSGLSYRFDDAPAALGFTASYESADFDCERPGLLKTVDRLRIHHRRLAPAILHTSLSTDGGATWASAVTNNILSAVDTTTLAVAFINVPRITGERFRVRITSSQPFAILGIDFEVFDRAESR